MREQGRTGGSPAAEPAQVKGRDRGSGIRRRHRQRGNTLQWRLWTTSLRPLPIIGVTPSSIHTSSVFRILDPHGDNGGELKMVMRDEADLWDGQDDEDVKLETLEGAGVVRGDGAGVPDKLDAADDEGLAGDVGEAELEQDVRQVCQVGAGAERCDGGGEAGVHVHARLAGAACDGRYGPAAVGLPDRWESARECHPTASASMGERLAMAVADRRLTAQPATGPAGVDVGCPPDGGGDGILCCPRSRTRPA
uniref:Uncharacterized protein n=1 Tax=Oryza brachyantha TaxID=4533 RepID=J3M8B5_ORYBR